MKRGWLGILPAPLLPSRPSIVAPLLALLRAESSKILFSLIEKRGGAKKKIVRLSRAGKKEGRGQINALSFLIP